MRRVADRWALACALPLLVSAARSPQDLQPQGTAASEPTPASTEQWLGLNVTSVAGADVYLDRGREHGLQRGDRVRLFPIGGAEIELVVRSVASRSARGEALDGASLEWVLPGTRGEYRVRAASRRPAPEAPDDTSASSDEPAQDEPGVRHPAWTHPPEEWSRELPLLAPAFGRLPRERAPRWRARTWLDGPLHDREGAR